MRKDTGGAAFPISGFTVMSRGKQETLYAPTPGMSLRDYFAAAALAEVPDPTSIADAPTTAALAYAIADAMLAERAKVQA